VRDRGAVVFLCIGFRQSTLPRFVGLSRTGCAPTNEGHGEG